MNKITNIILFTILMAISHFTFAATLTSMTKAQIEQAFINKTATSIPTDNLNGKTVNVSNSVFLDSKGNIFGSMSQKPVDEPQTDKGVYSIADDGTIYIKWQHWDEAKQLCFHMYETKNAYIAVDCNNVFHSVFMKAQIKSGNHIK